MVLNSRTDKKTTDGAAQGRWGMGEGRGINMDHGSLVVDHHDRAAPSGCCLRIEIEIFACNERDLLIFYR